MAINDPQAIKYCNEVVRPICEDIRALKARIDASRAQYDGQVGAFFYGHGGEAIDDGREAEGVSRLTGNDVLAWNALVNYDLKALLEANSGENVIQKPCVRPLAAN